MPTKKDSRLSKAGVTGYNKPKRTPSHPTKSHVVVAKSGNQVKTIRFGQQGVSGSPAKKGESSSDAARRKSFKAGTQPTLPRASCLQPSGPIK